MTKKVNVKDLILEEKRENEEDDFSELKKKIYKSNVNQSIFTDERGLVGIIAGIASVALILGNWALHAGEIAIGSLLSIIGIITKHPLMGYIFVIFFLFGDLAVTGVVGTLLPAGFVGTIISQVLSLLGLDIVVTTPMLLIIIVIFPLLMFALSKSGRR